MNLETALKIVLAFLVGLECRGVELAAPDGTWRDATAVTKSVLSLGFEASEKPHYHLPVYSISERGGINGGGALCITRSDPGEYSYESVPLGKLDPRQTYRLTLHARMEGMTDGTAFHIAGVEFSRGGKWVAGNYMDAAVASREFRTYEMLFSPLADAEATLALYMDHKITGKLFFDDVEVAALGAAYHPVLAQPSEETIRDASETLCFQVDCTAPAGLAVYAELEQGERTERLWLPVDKNCRAQGKLPGGWQPGLVTLRATVAKPAEKTVLGRAEFPLHRVAGALPSNACVIDAHGRAIVEGKPFLPVGLFELYYAPEDLQRAREAGFNCAVNYNTALFVNSWETIQERLDAAQKAGMRIILSVSQLYTPNFDRFAQYFTFTGLNDPYAIQKELARRFKDHPAMMGWYDSDEVTKNLVPAVIRSRQTLNEADPAHVVCTLTCHPSDLPYYALSGDVVMMDSYPFQYDTRAVNDISEATVFCEVVRRSGVPHWFVAQLFNWAMYQLPGEWTPERQRETHFPTTVELRAQSLLAAIGGAKGFFFWNYMDWYKKSAETIGGAGRELWPRIAPLAKLLNELAPYLLSLEAAPEVILEGNPAGVAARAFRSEDGKLCVIVAATSKPVDAVLRIGDAPSMHSRYGLTEALGEGRYRFRTKGIDADILE